MAPAARRRWGRGQFIMARWWLARNPRSAHPRSAARGGEFAIERLDELLFLNAAPTEVNASDWRQQTFSLGPLDLSAYQPWLTGPQALDTPSFHLIRGH